jgi:sucrose-6-phosphate hydrolase SacC (GH32 family)
MHWGRARSRDMINWERLPIALAPSFDKDETTIVSGGAVLSADGRPRLIYTSIGKHDPEVFANEGQAAIFTTMDAGPEDVAIEAFAKRRPGASGIVPVVAGRTNPFQRGTLSYLVEDAR